MFKEQLAYADLIKLRISLNHTSAKPDIACSLLYCNSLRPWIKLWYLYGCQKAILLTPIAFEKLNFLNVFLEAVKLSVNGQS